MELAQEERAEVKVGMTTDEVDDAIGGPDEEVKQDGRLTWIYEYSGGGTGALEVVLGVLVVVGLVVLVAAACCCGGGGGGGGGFPNIGGFGGAGGCSCDREHGLLQFRVFFGPDSRVTDVSPVFGAPTASGAGGQKIQWERP